jgi:cystathionine beta-lyase
MGEICQKYNVIVVSDEIHCDFVFGGNKHTVFGTICESFLQNSIICTSPSKTFNLAGHQTANIFIADGGLRAKFRKAIAKTGYSQLSTMGLVSCQAAYENGGEWLEELLAYLEQNYSYAKQFIAANLPKIRLAELEGTYLLWLDMNAYGFSETELDNVIVKKAGLWVSNGGVFGDEGKGFIRINIACPLSVLEKAFNRLAAALQ